MLHKSQINFEARLHQICEHIIKSFALMWHISQVSKDGDVPPLDTCLTVCIRLPPPSLASQQPAWMEGVWRQAGITSPQVASVAIYPMIGFLRAWDILDNQPSFE